MVIFSDLSKQLLAEERVKFDVFER